MLRDAQDHAAEDKKLHDVVAARNELDSIAYQVENTLRDLGDKAPAHERARAEQLIGEAREAIKTETPMERLSASSAGADRSANRPPHRRWTAGGVATAGVTRVPAPYETLVAGRQILRRTTGCAQSRTQGRRRGPPRRRDYSPCAGSMQAIR